MALPPSATNATLDDALFGLWFYDACTGTLERVVDSDTALPDPPVGLGDVFVAPGCAGGPTTRDPGMAEDRVQLACGSVAQARARAQYGGGPTRSGQRATPRTPPAGGGRGVAERVRGRPSGHQPRDLGAHVPGGVVS